MSDTNRKKVYFNVRTSSRERMWDTARQAARVCQPLTPPVTQQTSLARSESYTHTSTKYVRKLKHLVRTLPIFNTQAVPQSDEADLLYMWGAFPKHTELPYVLELDNPFALTYYNQWAITLRKRAIVKRLQATHRLTFMSATARNHALELFGQELTDHCSVLPPFMEENYKSARRTDDGLTRFLFVGLGFRRKGGPELLAAFSATKDPSLRLTVISHVPAEVIAAHAHDTRITFLPPQPRSVLFSDFYPTHDIFLFPSLLETLGVVILEALSFGMGIITTDVYATPEMVVTGSNGVLLTHPFLSHTTLNGQPVIDAVSIPRKAFSRRYLPNACYESMVPELTEAIAAATTHKTTWQENSVAHFNTHYAPAVWEERLRSILY